MRLLGKIEIGFASRMYSCQSKACIYVYRPLLKSQFQTQLGHCYITTVLTDIAQRLMFRHHLNDQSGLAGGSGFSFLAVRTY